MSETISVAHQSEQKEEIQQECEEYLLTENKQRFVLFPIKHHKIWEMVRLFVFSFSLLC